jgi:hypothetical protein
MQVLGDFNIIIPSCHHNLAIVLFQSIKFISCKLVISNIVVFPLKS